MKKRYSLYTALAFIGIASGTLYTHFANNANDISLTSASASLGGYDDEKLSLYNFCYPYDYSLDGTSYRGWPEGRSLAGEDSEKAEALTSQMLVLCARGGIVIGETEVIADAPMTPQKRSAIRSFCENNYTEQFIITQPGLIKADVAQKETGNHVHHGSPLPSQSDYTEDLTSDFKAMCAKQGVATQRSTTDTETLGDQSEENQIIIGDPYKDLPDSMSYFTIVNGELEGPDTCAVEGANQAEAFAAFSEFCPWRERKDCDPVGSRYICSTRAFEPSNPPTVLNSQADTSRTSPDYTGTPVQTGEKLCAVLGENQSQAFTLFSQFCPGTTREDCDPVDEGYICSTQRFDRNNPPAVVNHAQATPPDEGVISAIDNKFKAPNIPMQVHADGIIKCPTTSRWGVRLQSGQWGNLQEYCKDGLENPSCITYEQQSCRR